MAPAAKSSENTGEVVKVTTALKILTLLDERAPAPLATHGIGLQIQDPTNPLSVIMKTLARDGYIRRVGDNGKRSGLWELTEIGKRSILRRSNASNAARAWLRENPSLDQVEQTVLQTLHNDQSLSPAQISDATGLRVAAIRQAIRDLAFRSLVDLDQNSEVATLSANGVKVTLQLQSFQTERAATRDDADMTVNSTRATEHPTMTSDNSENRPDIIRKAVIDKLDAAEKLLKTAEVDALHAQQNVQSATRHRDGLRDTLRTLDTIIAELFPNSPIFTVPVGQATLAAVTEPDPPAPLSEPRDEGQNPARPAQSASVQAKAGEVVAPVKRGRGRPRKNPSQPAMGEVTSSTTSVPIAALHPDLTANEVDLLRPESKVDAQVTPRTISTAAAVETAQVASRKAGTMKRAILQVVRDGGAAGLSRLQIFEAVERIYDGQLKPASLRTTLFDLGKKGFIKSDAGNWTVSNGALVDASISG